MFNNIEEYEKFLIENILSAQQIADLLTVSRARVSQLVKNDELRPFFEQKNGHLFSKQEFERYKRE